MGTVKAEKKNERTSVPQLHYLIHCINYNNNTNKNKNNSNNDNENNSNSPVNHSMDLFVGVSNFDNIIQTSMGISYIFEGTWCIHPLSFQNVTLRVL